MASADMITLGHVNIRTDRLEETCRFYESVLGFRRGPALTVVEQENNVWLHDADGQPCVHVNVFRPGERPVVEGAPHLHHVAFNCPNREAMAANLARLRLDYAVNETRVPGLVQFNLRDPNGVLVELAFGHEATRQTHTSERTGR